MLWLVLVFALLLDSSITSSSSKDMDDSQATGIPMRDLQSLSSVMNQSRTVIAFYTVKIMIRNRIVYVTARSVSAWS
jgi:hypothetical protein